jgi:hypothetical protein
MKFTLEIDLSNDEMQTFPDISNAIAHIVRHFSLRGDVEIDNGKIYDANGNKFGIWEISD